MDFKSLVKNNFAELSESQQKIAKYILDNLEEVVFDTAYQLGKKNSVSETTIIRFSYALGFEGFSDMNKAMRRSIIKNTETISQDICMVDQWNKLSHDQLVDCFQSQVIQGSKAYSNINFQEFKKICDMIMTKKKVLIIGYMDSFGTASELLHLLDKVRNKVYFYRLLHEERNILYDMDEDSLVITVSFAPHYKYTLEYTETAQKGGCSVVTFADSMINPFTSLSDHTLVFNVQRNAEINLIDMSPVTRFIYFMVNYIYINYKDQIDKYRNSIEWRDEKYIE
ncbi:MAG TPA: MurR/RpiR family transcriptional regulator [Patescibacteria group bacterium]|nr:MurR/RpiR family transcriptional regulator [Patescibacteria group bacterium]